MTEVCPDLCLICATSLDGARSSNNKPLNFGNHSNLDQELEVIFVLGNILQVPSSLCAEVLARHGPPSTWGLQFCFCTTCRRMVHEAHFIFSRIQNLMKEFETLRKEINGMTVISQEQKKNKGRKRKADTPILKFRHYLDERGTIKVEPVSKPNPRNRKSNVHQAKKQASKRPTTKRPPQKLQNDEQNEENEECFGKSVLFYNESEAIINLELKAEPIDIDFPTNDDYFCDEESDNIDNIAFEDNEDEENPRRSLRPRDNKPRISELIATDQDDEDEDGFGEWDPEPSDEDDDTSSGEEKESDGNLDPEYSDGVDKGTTKTTRKKSFSTRKPTSSSTNTSRKSGKSTWEKCDLCPTVCRTPLILEVHRKRVHEGERRAYGCQFCQRTFRSLGVLLYHIDISHHSDIKINENQELLDLEEGNPPDDDVKKRVHYHDNLKLFDRIFEVEEIDASTIDHQSENGVDKTTESVTADLEYENQTEPNESQTTEKNGRKASKSKRKKKRKHPEHGCTKCSYNFRFEYLLHAHILRCHYGELSPFQCDICDKKFNRKVRMFKHRKQNHPSCNKPYEGPEMSLEERIANVPKMEPKIIITSSVPKNHYKCRFCDLSFKSRISAQIHIKIFHEGKSSKYPCSECGLFFLSEPGRKIHYEQIHVPGPTINEIDYYCCDQHFPSIIEFEEHKRMKHSEKQKFMCEICSQILRDSSSLKFHQKLLHHKELGLVPIKCEQCDKILYSNRALKAHTIKEHTKEFPFICDICGMGRSSSFELKQHLMIHAVDKPFKCKICGRGFANRYSLIYHSRIHTGEKPHKCKVPGCGKEYSDKSTFNRHVETHGDKVHVCPTCNREFKVWHSFRLHCKTHDPNFVPRNFYKEKNISRRKTSNEKRIDEDCNPSSNSMPMTEFP